MRKSILFAPFTQTQTLVLSDNRICDAGASALGTVLTRGNASLTSFNIAHNNVSDAGAEVITHALNSNSTLREVFLSVNRIRDRGVVPLFKALATNKTLMHLDLGLVFFFGRCLRRLRSV